MKQTFWQNHLLYRMGLYGSGMILLAAAMSVCGCEDYPPTTRPGSKSPRVRQVKRGLGFIAFIGAGKADPVWPILKASAQRYARDMGELEIRYICPRVRSPQSQMELLRSLDDPKMRGICIQIIEPNALKRQLDRLFTSGIRIVSMIQPASPELRNAHVGFDDFEVGKALAQATAKSLDDAGTIMLLHADNEHPIYGPRLSEFKKELFLHPSIEVFAKIDCKMDGREARRIIRQRSKRFPRLSAWVALDDWPLRSLGITQKIFPNNCKFITFGGTPEQWPLIRNGTCPNIVAANYRELGSKAVLFCEIAIKEPSRFPSVYNAPLRIVQTSNLDDYINDWNTWSSENNEEDEAPLPPDLPVTTEQAAK